MLIFTPQSVRIALQQKRKSANEMHTMQGRCSPSRGLSARALCRVLCTDRGSEQTHYGERVGADVGGEIVSRDLFYIGSALLAVGLWACAVVALWAVVEGVYWIYCRVRGRDY